jgi:hypothetical protein
LFLKGNSVRLYNNRLILNGRYLYKLRSFLE